MAAEDVPVQQAQAYADAIAKANKLASSLIEKYKLMSVALRDQKAISQNDLKIKQQVSKEYVDQISAIREIKKTNVDLAKSEMARVRTLITASTSLMKQAAILENINDLNEKNRRIQDQEIKIMEKKGHMFKAWGAQLALNARRNFQTESGHTTKVSVAQGAATAGAAAGQIAQDPKQLLSMMGPWGVIAGIIMDVIDGVRAMRGELMKASAESGVFEKSMVGAQNGALRLYSQQAELMLNYGMDVKDVAQIYADLKNTGIQALGVIPKTGDAMSKMAANVMAFAKATNQSSAEVAGQMADMVRGFGIAESRLGDTYLNVYSMASDAAEKGIAKVSEMVKTVFSLGDAFKDVGINISQVSKITGAVGSTLKKLGQSGGIAEIQKVSQGLLGLTKAGEGWQVFMSKMSGNQGGFASSLFSAQQRTSGNTLTEAGQQDMGKTFSMLKNTLMKTTSGISDPKTKQYMVEKIAGQMGMDAKTTQVFQKMSAGGLSDSAAIRDLKKIQEAAKEQNMSSKGMFDILRAILVGMIAKPIIAIWSWLAKDGKSKEQAKKASEAVNKVNAELPKPEGSAVGSYVRQSGLMMVHAGNTITPAAKRTAYGSSPESSPKGSSGGNQFNFNIMLDEKNIHGKFQEMEQKTLRHIRKQQQANFA